MQKNDVEISVKNLHPAEVQDREQLEQLFAAILRDDRAGVQKLLRQNPSLVSVGASEPNLSYEIMHWIYVGDTALHAAAAGYRIEIAKALLAAGANPNAAQNHRHSRPLHYAADGCITVPTWDSKRQVKTLALLLDAGAEINSPDKNGATALHRAVRTRCPEAVEFLLARGANATAFNKPGSTPFHLAVQNTGRGGSGDPAAIEAQRQIIQTFLAHGLRPNLKDARGRTVRDWARSESLQQLLSGS